MRHLTKLDHFSSKKFHAMTNNDYGGRSGFLAFRTAANPCTCRLFLHVCFQIESLEIKGDGLVFSYTANSIDYVTAG